MTPMVASYSTAPAVDPARPSTIHGAGWAGLDLTHADEFRLSSEAPTAATPGPTGFPDAGSSKHDDTKASVWLML